MDELRKRLAQLRAEQDARQLTIEGTIEGNVVPIRPPSDDPGNVA
jgi:hypothetical protein